MVGWSKSLSLSLRSRRQVDQDPLDSRFARECRLSRSPITFRFARSRRLIIILLASRSARGGRFTKTPFFSRSARDLRFIKTFSLSLRSMWLLTRVLTIPLRSRSWATFFLYLSTFEANVFILWYGLSTFEEEWNLTFIWDLWPQMTSCDLATTCFRNQTSRASFWYSFCNISKKVRNLTFSLCFWPQVTFNDLEKPFIIKLRSRASFSYIIYLLLIRFEFWPKICNLTPNSNFFV